MSAERVTSRAYSHYSKATSWEEIWEAGPYYDRISELLEGAENYAIFVGWQIDSRLPLRKSFYSLETLKEKVIRLCEEHSKLQIYFLMWDHAYLYVYEREFWQTKIWKKIHQRVHFIFDNRHPMGAAHHEKIALIDGRVALCGGIDLCADRWDSIHHHYQDQRRSLDWKKEKHRPYHDLAVQVTGPICQEIEKHVRTRWNSLSGISIPSHPSLDPSYTMSPNKTEGHSVYLSRTLVMLESPPLVREVEFLFRDLILRAEKRLILEGQYYWSQTLNDLLISKILKMQGTDFEIYLILSELENIGSLTRVMMPYELKLISQLKSAASFAGIRLRIGAPYVFSASSPNLPPKPIYIHSKVLVVDDRYLGIGSANFATRALRVDSEIQLTLEAITEQERLHIQSVGDFILKHWSLVADERNELIYFREFKPRMTLFRLQQSRMGRFSWAKFFDPAYPWLIFLKRNFLKRGLNRKGLFLSFFSVSLVYSGAVSLVLQASLQTFFFLLFMSGAWWMPCSFLLIWAVYLLSGEPHLASKIGCISLVFSAITGYIFVRNLPKGIKELTLNKLNSSNLAKLKKRKLSSTLLVALNPRLSLQSKIISQGYYFIPLGWFLLGMGIILPITLFFSGTWVFSYLIFNLSLELREILRLILFSFIFRDFLRRLRPLPF